MTARLRSWWQNRKQHSLIVAAIFVVLLAFIAFIFAAYHFSWSGTGFLNKTLWDWLQLLIILLALAGVALLFNLATTGRDQQISLDKQWGDLLQAYLDRMSELLLEKKLLCLRLFMGDRTNVNSINSSIVSLGEADFRTVDWSQGYLTNVKLSNVNLSGANLTKTDLTKTDLSNADLSNADLSRATGTTSEQLKKARSLKDAIMPNGSKQP